MSDQPSTRKLAPIDPELYSQYRDVDRWAVIIGISKYQDASLNLRYADRDAESLYELLLTENGGKFKPENICKLVNAEATYAKIREALYDFLDKPKREDLVLIYLACHGASNPNRPDQLYFLTHDVNLSKIAATALPMDEIDRAVKQTIRADKIIILADTCHSAGVGGAIGNRNVNQSSERMNRYLEQLSNAQDGIALLTSAEATQVARESEQWGDGHGVFTYYLLEGMRGAADTNRDGIISIGELFEYVRKEVIAATDNRQHPVIGANRYDRNLPLAITALGGEQQVIREATAHPTKQVLNVPAIVPIPKNPIVSEKPLFSLNKRAILTAVTALSALGVITIISRPINGTMISQPPASVISTAQVLKPAEKGTEHIKLQLVNCNVGLDCFLAHSLLPNSTKTDQFDLIFENTDSTAVELLNSTAFAQGSITGHRLNDWAFTTPQNAIFPANQVTVFPLLLNRSAMPPDRYIGEVRLTLKNRKSLVLPVNMSVRSGPLMPLLVLLLGIILGNLFEHRYSQPKAREKVYQLEEDIRDAHP
ncbi:caspase family protein, partial [Leptolyngbya sp. FACHB-711]|uniref:caspase family protein n=1 Tax=Leptolyngbya sp. FACHB-711 TaxID=2692813 RepID=UPI0016827285